MKKSSALVSVVDNIDLGGLRFRLRLKADDIHLACRPGQFFNLGFPSGAPYLPRPFSVYEMHPSERTLDLLVAVVGEGTRQLAACRPGSQLRLIGPLGRGFPLDDSPDERVFVAGSIGLAPFIEYHKALRTAGETCPHTLIYGARTGAELVDVPFLEGFDWTVMTCTDDGSAGRHGRVTDVLATLSLTDAATLYTCGPTPMMRAVHAAAGSVPLWVSMEEHMACGIGICKGCVLDDGRSPPPLTTVCKDGPVFQASDVFELSRETS